MKQTKANSNSSWTPGVSVSNLLQRKCASRNGPIQAKTLRRSAITTSPAPAVPQSVHETLRSPGQPLDMSTRAFMEPRFGRDFSHVRVHADSHAAESARDVNAHAYAVGHQVVFGSGKYSPSLPEGRQLLAHELAHTVQQGSKNATHVGGIAPQDAAESEAENIAGALLHNQRISAGQNLSETNLLRRQSIYPQDVDKTLDPKTPPLAGPYTTGPLVPGPPPPQTPPPVVACLNSADCKQAIPGSSWDFSHKAEEKRSSTEQEMKKDPEKAKALGTARPAVNLKAFANKEDPKILASVSEVRVEPSMEGASGGRATDCKGGIPKPAAPACIEVPDKLEKGADLFNNTTGLMIQGWPRAQWKTMALSTLVHESQHISFDQSPPVTAGKTTNSQGVYLYSPEIFLYELGEINSLLSEYPVRYRGMMAEQKQSPEQKTDAVKSWIIDYAINNKMEDLRGMLKKLRCISPCSEVNTAVKQIFDKQSTNWTKEQKDLFVSVVSDPKQGLDWPK